MPLSIHKMSESVSNGAAIFIAEVYNCLDSIRARMIFLNQERCSIDGEYDFIGERVRRETGRRRTMQVRRGSA